MKRSYDIGSDYHRAVQQELDHLERTREAKHGPQPFGGHEYFDLVRLAHEVVAGRVRGEGEEAA